MTKRLFWQTAILAAGMGSLPAYAATATDAQTQETFRLITAEETAEIQQKLNTKEMAAADQVKPVTLPAQNPAAAEIPAVAATAEPRVAAKPVAQPAPAEAQAPKQETAPTEVATQSNAPKPDTSEQSAEAQAIESHKAKMALRQEIIRQAAEQQGMQQKNLTNPRQETASPVPVGTAPSAEEQRRQQVLSEIETRRQLAEKARAESSTAATARSKQHQDALEALRANQNARAQAMAQRREAAEKAMQAHREEMEQRIQQHQEGLPAGSRESQEELISSMQDRRKAMREHMAKRRAEQRSVHAEEENKSLAQTDEQRAKMQATHKQRQEEMAARRKAMSERIDTAIDNMGRNPWGPPPGTRQP